MQTTPTFPPWHILAQRARERTAQPIELNGEIFHATNETASLTGRNTVWLRKRVAYIPGEGEPVTSPCGIRFVRLPRHKGDLRAPLYFDVSTVPMGKRKGDE